MLVDLTEELFEEEMTLIIHLEVVKQVTQPVRVEPEVLDERLVALD